MIDNENERLRRRSDTDDASGNSAKRNRKRGCLIPTIIGGILILLIGAGVWKVYSDIRSTTDDIYHKAEPNEKRSNKVNISDGKDAFSVLLMGIDTGEYGRVEQGRSDTMILMTVNPSKKQTTLLSIPRDTYTFIDNVHQKDKINHAYAFNGPSGAMNAVQQLLDVPVDYFVSVNMEGLEQLVNVVGGITVVPPISFNQDGYTFTAGTATKLNGQQALAYVRNRYDDPNGDYGRQARQREVILAAMKQVLTLSSLPNYNEILNTLGHNVQTNLQFDDLMALFNHYRDATSNIKELQLKGSGTMINGVYYEIIPEENIAQVSQQLKQELAISH